MITRAGALSVLPSGLRADLLRAFQEIVSNYREHRWEPSELNGGKFCEAVYTVIEGYLAGSYPPRVRKPNRFPDACLALEAKYASVPNSRSPRILIPRMMVGLYDIRNNRGVGHAGGDVDPNQMDATVVLYTSKWLMAELVRMLHTATTEEATSVVEELMERELAWVWSHKDVKRLLRTGLTWKQQVLVMMLSEPSGVTESDLVRWLEHPKRSDFRSRVLTPMHRERLIEYDREAGTVRLLPPGVASAEQMVQARTA